ncbi:MAG: ATP-binding cassette domain-containing protein [Gammaproteobacteria bacterium]|nr:ATP-binding cassette domain-containing protein [Gammaproteobacteria bacterium]
MSETPVLECRDLGRTYTDGGLSVPVLRAVNFVLPAAAKVAIVGASGSGKSTLLNLFGGLDVPTTGHVLMLGRDINQMSEAERCRFRNQSLGFVYQFHHLLPEFSAQENVAMPLLIAGEKRRTALASAAKLLAKVGLEQRLLHRPAQLSGGERQRVAIARALVMQPACVLMDEPTGNLDPGASRQVLDLMDELMRDTTASFVVVTHAAEIAAHMDQIWELADACLLRQGAD